MKNTKRTIATIVAALFVVVGVFFGALGFIGQGYYAGATAVLGCKKAETINYFQDPSLVTGVSKDASAERIIAYLTDTCGMNREDIEEVVNRNTVYAKAVADSGNINALLEFLQTNRGITVEEAREVLKDETTKAEAAQEYVSVTVKEALGCTDEEVAALETDEGMAEAVRSGLTKLKTDNGFKTTLFNNAILYLFIGIILFIVGAAYFFIKLMDDSKKTKVGKTVKVNPKAVKVGEFLLNYALYIILIAILVAVCIARPKFLDVNNILNILKQASTKGILALGCAGLIVLAGTDLSIGRILGLSAAVTASLVQAVNYSSRMFPQMTTQLPLFIPLLASIAVAVIFTLINGFGVAKLHLHAFIITLGTQLIAQGLCCIYIESQPSGTAQALSTFDQKFIDVAAGNLTIGTMRIPLVVLYFIGIAAIMWVVWNKTRLGKNMFAVGGNTEAAAVSGVNVAKTIMLVYLIAGILYGTSAFLEAARITSVGANTGLNYETDAISACVVGGVSFSGGVGTIQGVVIGAVILQAINYSLQFLGVNPYLQYVVRGLIIILAVSIDVRKYIAKK